MTNPTTRDILLDTAEMLFADRGFHGASLRMITKAANAQLAAAAYHFGTKEQLFRCVIERRAAELNAERLAMLASAAAPPVTTEGIVKAVIEPLLRRATAAGPGWRNYCRLIATTSATAQWRDLVSEYFDDVARTAIALLGRRHGTSSERDRQAAYYFVIGLMTFVFAESGRLDRLTSDRYRSDALDDVYADMLPFLIAGVEKLLTRKAGPRRRRSASS